MNKYTITFTAPNGGEGVWEVEAISRDRAIVKATTLQVDSIDEVASAIGLPRETAPRALHNVMDDKDITVTVVEN